MGSETQPEGRESHLGTLGPCALQRDLCGEADGRGERMMARTICPILKGIAEG